ncbi:hypothetical protein C8F04DRAFT_1193999 [Mycena alexandri]|uniref:Uncharacterized protein n=1 Tax=Mycena alexandri TaxID=1745969 RepID=A0AAD6SA66_9AGAR|nr:hypothetical protein C8F04DRAFT_1193999 [Mycena alexandri]
MKHAGAGDRGSPTQGSGGGNAPGFHTPRRKHRMRGMGTGGIGTGQSMKVRQTYKQPVSFIYSLLQVYGPYSSIVKNTQPFQGLVHTQAFCREGGDEESKKSNWEWRWEERKRGKLLQIQPQPRLGPLSTWNKSELG